MSRFLLVSAAASLLLGCEAPSNAVVLHNGKVFTADPAKPWAQAVLIVDDTIAAVGSNDEILAKAPKGARRVDVKRQIILPGFNDAHDHIDASLPAKVILVDRSPTPDPTYEALRDSLRAAVRRQPPGTRLRFFVGERILSDQRARRDSLDAVAPRHPVELRAWSGHGVVLNGLAMSQAGIADTIPDPLGGRFERDRNGRITGLMEEYASWNQWVGLTAGTDSAYRAAVVAHAKAAAALGITTIQNMSTGVTAAALARIIPTLDLPVRVRFIRFPLTTPNGRDAASWLSLSVPASERVYLSGIKYILDGTPVERLAAQRKPYADQAGWAGRLNLPPDTLRVALEEAARANQQPMIHAVGDLAVGVALDALAAAAPDSVWRRLRPRIEHGEGFSPDHFALAKRLGVVFVQNPTHFALPMAAARYGAERMAILQPARSTLAGGIPFAIGSDGPQNPFLNIMLATIHPNRPAEGLSVEQAVAAYTAGSAFAEGKESEKGMIKPGLVADIAVVSADIFSIAKDWLPRTTVSLTLVAGKPVYDPAGWFEQPRK